jgi:fatty acid desaturase
VGVKYAHYHHHNNNNNNDNSNYAQSYSGPADESRHALPALPARRKPGMERKQTQ